MKIAIAIVFLATFFSLNSLAQSNDGWFTTKINAGWLQKNNNCNYAFCATHLFNIENHFSVGLYTGIYFKDIKCIPMASCLRIRPFGKKLIMPTINTIGGWNLDISDNKNSNGLFLISMGLETGFLHRFNYLIDIGFLLLQNNNYLSVSVGIEF